ncbi:MAG TPA: type II toxin-antitoxin system prevent-host-death family antitoxin [Solirubrobacterales bacterium]
MAKKQVTATEAKANILRLLDEVADGQEIEITRHGRPVARLLPAPGTHFPSGSLAGLASTAPGVTDEELFTIDEEWEVT